MGTWASIFTIILNAAITITITYITINSQLPKMLAETHSLEIKNNIEAFQFLDAELDKTQCNTWNSERASFKIDHFIKLYDMTAILKLPDELKAKYQGVPQTKMCPEERNQNKIVTPQHKTADENNFVVVGTFDKGLYQNFTVRNHGSCGGATLCPEDIIQSRWSVFFRENLTDIDLGKNLVTGTLPQGECLKVIKPFPDIRGKTWAQVRKIDCPS